MESAAPITPSPASAAPPGPSAADQLKEIDNLRDEVKDLNEKLDTLKGGGGGSLDRYYQGRRSGEIDTGSREAAIILDQRQINKT